jgi:hypothetical protein
VHPISIPGLLLRAGRSLVWNRTVPSALPKFARLPFWRLSLIVSDGFWFNTAKFRQVYRAPIRTLDQGLEDIVPKRDAEHPL